MSISIRAHVRMENGRLLSKANAHRIIARSTRPTDRSGNSLPSPIERYRNDPPYYQTWTIVKEAKGYIFREKTNGAGICGCHKTIRQLVIATLLSSHIVVEVV